MYSTLPDLLVGGLVRGGGRFEKIFSSVGVVIKWGRGWSNKAEKGPTIATFGTYVAKSPKNFALRAKMPK